MKARDIIPGWPRGRSMRRGWPSATNPDEPFSRAHLHARYGWSGPDPRYWEDWENEKAEQRRKSAAWEAYWRAQQLGWNPVTQTFNGADIASLELKEAVYPSLGGGRYHG